MRLVWTIKIYEYTSLEDRWRVKIEGVPYGYSQPWVIGGGGGRTQSEAYKDALSSIRSGTTPELCTSKLEKS